MFNGYYETTLVYSGPSKTNSEIVLKESLYRFKTDKNQTYIVMVEQYHHDIFIIKFYLKAHRNSDFKYNFLTGFHEPSRILGTCLQIAISILKANPKASLGFIGAATIDEIKAKLETDKARKDAKDQGQEFIESPKKPTKRFSVYIGVAANFFSPEKFLHVEDQKNNAYAIINKNNENPFRLKAEIEKMFHKHYVLPHQLEEQRVSDIFGYSQSG